jgi:hypothetical protein
MERWEMQGEQLGERVQKGVLVRKGTWLSEKIYLSGDERGTEERRQRRGKGDYSTTLLSYQRMIEGSHFLLPTSVKKHL